MPYGTIGPETAIWLREAGYDMAWNVSDYGEDAVLRTVDIVVDGALDESFAINDIYSAEDIAACIGSHLKLNGELNDWDVVVYYSHTSEELAHWSQKP